MRVPLPTPVTATAVRQGEATPTRDPDPAEPGDEERDHLRHIICMLCYPAFDQALEAPHDAVCLCGKQLRAGEKRGPSDAPQCILCNELREHHYATVHPDE